MDNTPSKKFKDFDWKQLEEDMSLYEEYLLKRKRAIELQNARGSCFGRAI